MSLEVHTMPLVGKELTAISFNRESLGIGVLSYSHEQ